MKKVISIIISCIIMLSSVSICVLAASNNGIDFSGQPISTDPNNPTDNGVNPNGYHTYIYGTGNVYAFTVPANQNYNSLTIFCSENITDSAYLKLWNNGMYTGGQFNNTWVYNNHIYYQSMGSNTLPANTLLPLYNTIEDGLADFEAYIGNINAPIPTYDINYTLPAGNVAYIEFNSDFDTFELSTVMPVSSYVIGGDPWPQSNQYYGFASSIPSGNFTLPSSRITWSRNGRTSIAGITKNAIFDYGPHHPTSGNYLVVYNPAYYGGTDNGPYEFMNNGSITISASNVISITVLQLDSQLTFGQNGVLDVDTTLTGEEYNGEFDEETGDIIWENGSVPVEGGGNLPVSSESQFNSFLSNLIQKIINIFAPAQEAIQTLSSAISGFANYLYALYVWLPAPVLSLLTSAITLAIVIGVIKVFL